MAELRDRVVIDDGFIEAMLRGNSYLKAFPWLRRYASRARTGTGCGSCRRKAAAAAVDYGAIKRSLASMPKADQRRLLELAQARSVKLVYRNAEAQVVNLVIESGAT